jgi:hypothetical protein
MRKLSFICLACLFFINQSCTKTGSGEIGGLTDAAGGFSTGPGSSGGGSGNPGGTAGKMTAGEWNDIEHWDFWKTLMERDTIKTFPGVWEFYTQNRVSVTLKDINGKLIHDAKIDLTFNGTTISGRTDNFGNAQLCPGLYQNGFTLADFTLMATVAGQTFNLGSFSSSETTINKTVPVNKPVHGNLDVMFVVDATGSMGDEISFLKTELLDVINRAGNELPGTQIRLGSVFYRDFGDNYVTRPFPFTTNKNILLNFINDQNAGGGGDFPEAVEMALQSAIPDQQWSSNAVNRLLFLILDAPPHKSPDVMTKLKNSITLAHQKGIRIIPVSASGIDWETEFLLRFMAISTNSTYVFITDHSGIGNPHHNATVGNYTVEYLNDLMVRLITKYGKNHD